ncbi:MAG: glutathione S-transferase family protein [Gammaproteobacteria bacterium]|nr:glutathione S-transferase family protein [Gammaproteobacteria bacterium]MDH4253318.1 glutathione S-transferase family protein [Gammaproteobacteria bacterium]MDH5309927.1 glutathione S-transferase family protein [Gammaproteobacteria bacterium]
MIELYHWEPVSHSARTLICLHEIGVEYQGHYVDLLEFEHFGADFLALNRLAQVPVLRTNGVCLTESALISEYLAESFRSAALAPFDALGWYRTQTWSKWIDYNLSSSLGTLGTRKYLVAVLANRDRDDLEKAIAAIPVAERRSGWELAAKNTYGEDLVTNSRRKVELVVQRMEQRLAENQWLVGDAYSIADINTFAMIHSLADIVPDLVNTRISPHTMAWRSRIAERPAVREALALGRRFPTGRICAPGPEHSRWG